jgi:hypothetical protein
MIAFLHQMPAAVQTSFLNLALTLYSLVLVGINMATYRQPAHPEPVEG